MTFNLLSKRIQNYLKELGFKEETEPQKEAIPLILKGFNVLLISPTGTGKTEAAILPIFDLIYNKKGKGIIVLYITPLRALNRDLLDRITLWCSKLDLRCSVRHGDTLQSERRKQALFPPDILITTPETLQILLVSKLIRNHLKNVKHVIIDEVHEIAEDKRGVQLSVGLERLRKICSEFQIIGLSATVGEPEKLAKFLVGKNRKCKIVYVPAERYMKIKISYPIIKEEDKINSEKLFTYPEVFSRLRKIKEIVLRKKAYLIFTNTRTEAEILGSKLRMLGLDTLVHHSSLSRDSRLFAETSLKAGEIRGIICTSSLELGIDIGRIEHVIQYNSPRQATRLVQRIGRSGHYIKGIAEGTVISTNPDTFFESYVILMNAFKGKYEEINIPIKSYDVLAHQIVGLLLEKDFIKVDEIIEILKKTYSYEKIEIKDVEKVLNILEKLKPKVFHRENDKIVRRIGAYNYYFENLSMIPDEVNYLVINYENDECIGELSEEFIAEYGEPGVKFILKGETWEILTIEENKRKIYCKKNEEIFGAIPSWIGEEIPVSEEISKEAANLRKKVYENVNREDVYKFFSEEIVKKEEFEQILKVLKETYNKKIPLANDELIVIEEKENLIIINSTFGNKINRTLGKLIAYFSSKILGKSLRITQDPYRIIIFSKELNAEDIIKILNNSIYYDLENLFNKILNEEENLVKFRFLHVAKRFGIIKRDAIINKKIIQELINEYKETVIFEETINEILRKDLDLKNTFDKIRKIGKNEIKIIKIKGISPLTSEALKYFVKEATVPSPKDSEKFLIEIYKTKIRNKLITIFCTNCWEYIEPVTIESLKYLTCPICNSKKISVSKLPFLKIRKIVYNISEEKKDRKIEILKKKYEKVSSLIEKYGKLALIVFSANISFKDSLIILEKIKEENDILYLILAKFEAERLSKLYKFLFYKKKF